MHIDSFFSHLQHIFNNFLWYSLQALNKDNILNHFLWFIIIYYYYHYYNKTFMFLSENVMCDSFEVNIKKLQFFLAKPNDNLKILKTIYC